MVSAGASLALQRGAVVDDARGVASLGVRAVQADGLDADADAAEPVGAGRERLVTHRVVQLVGGPMTGQRRSIGARPDGSFAEVVAAIPGAAGGGALLDVTEHPPPPSVGCYVLTNRHWLTGSGVMIREYRWRAPQ